MKLLILLVLASLFVSSLEATEFIVFIHGLAGFGPDELFGLGYWGMPLITGRSLVDYVATRTGLQAFEASVGPVSSNHDRAAELYAQIKGTRVDYGVAHAAEMSHDRFGRDYTGQGFFPNWDENNKVHFVGHSMGGQTIRFIEAYLRNGLDDEINANYGDISELYNGVEKKWIASVHTIASPLDGSTLHTKLDAHPDFQVTDLIKDALLGISQASELVSLFTGQGAIYNFDLGHHPEFETWSNDFADNTNFNDIMSTFENIKNNPKWDNNYLDLADYDMSPHKWKVFGQKYPRSYDDTYYFAVQTDSSHSCALIGGDQCADWDSNPLMGATATIMGNLDWWGSYCCGFLCLGTCYLAESCTYDQWGDCFGDSWEENDGLVPIRSSTGPTFGYSTSDFGRPQEHPTNFWGTRQWGVGNFNKGTWYYREEHYDHLQVVGMLTFQNPEGVYDDVARLINEVKA